jgi:phage tail sheath gpL-like
LLSLFIVSSFVLFVISRFIILFRSPPNFNTGKAQSLPQRLALIGVGNDTVDYGLGKMEVGGSASVVGDRFGYGSPLHLAAKQLFPLTGASAEFPVTIYPLAKANSATAAAGTATANGSGTVYVGGIAVEFCPVEFAATKDDTAAAILGKIKDAINRSLDIPAFVGVIAEGILPLTSKWSGESSNMITLEMDANVPGILFTLTGFAGGAIDPDVTPALEKIGIVWETMILDCFDYKKLTNLDAPIKTTARDGGTYLKRSPCWFVMGVRTILKPGRRLPIPEKPMPSIS